MLVVARVVVITVAWRVRLVVVGRSTILAVADPCPGVGGGHGTGRGGGRGVARRARVVRLSTRRPAVPRAARAAIRGHTYQSPLA